MKNVTDSAGSILFGEAIWNYLKYGAGRKAYSPALTKEHKINHAFASASFNRRFSFMPTAAGLKLMLAGLSLILTTVNISAARTCRNEQPVKSSTVSSNQATLDCVKKILRLRLYKDQYDYDDIVVGFNSLASPAYSPYEDAAYFPGMDAAEGLASYSSDGVALSIYFLPLPKQTPDIIRLDVEAANSGPITLKRTELDSLPPIYSIWLVDSYKKDSIDLRTDSNYVFNINKADTASFGSCRFHVAVRLNAPAPFQLLGFNAVRASSGAEISWKTKNEENYTLFNVERSNDGGSTFQTIDTLNSTSAGTYNFTDNKLPPATEEYRLKITDVAGTISYSNEVTLSYSNIIHNTAGNISIYPNPASNTLNLKIDQNNSVASLPTLAANAINDRPLYNIKIINITGSVVKNATSVSTSWQNDVSGLNAGTYIIQVVDNKNNSLVGRETFIKM